jgi:hypothetical protein
MNAWILGNGKARQHLQIPDDVFVYGCNHIYKDDIANVVVSTDIPMQHEIYQSGYAHQRYCIFLDWSPVDVSIVPFLNLEGKIVANAPTEHGVVIGTENNNHYITYIQQEDAVENITLAQLPMEFSSGSLAMWHAAKSGFKEITLAGFGDTQHYYRTDYTGPNPVWQKEREYIINQFPNIIWRNI